MNDEEESNYVQQVAQKQKNFSEEFEKRLQAQKFNFDAPENNKMFLENANGKVILQEEEEKVREDPNEI